MTGAVPIESIPIQEALYQDPEEEMTQKDSGSARKKSKVQRSLRDRIVLDHLPLVKAIAVRVHENLPVHVDLDDLIHAGILGLFDAASKYDAEKKVVFHSYAKHRIKGAILDSLRQLDWASRSPGICRPSSSACQPKPRSPPRWASTWSGGARW